MELVLLCCRTACRFQVVVASAVGHNPRRLLQSYSPRLAEGLLMTLEVSRVPQDFYMIWSACLVHNWPGGTIQWV